MADCGLLFYCDHQRPVGALVVALWTLRQSYDGPLHIVFGPDAPNWLIRELSKREINSKITCKTLDSYDFPECTGGKRGSWCQKPFAIRRSPFELTLYFDCDHLFVGTEWPNRIWDEVGRLGLASAHDKLIARRCGRVVRDVRAVMGIALESYRPVNGGCIGYRQGYEGMQSWIAYMTRYVRQGQSRLLRGLAEEHALGLTLNTGLGGWIDGSISQTCFPHPRTQGYHLNGGRYLRNAEWQQELHNCFAADFLGIRRNSTAFLQTDSHLSLILTHNSTPAT